MAYIIFMLPPPPNPFPPPPPLLLTTVPWLPKPPPPWNSLGGDTGLRPEFSGIMNTSSTRGDEAGEVIGAVVVGGGIGVDVVVNNWVVVVVVWICVVEMVLGWVTVVELLIVVVVSAPNEPMLVSKPLRPNDSLKPGGGVPNWIWKIFTKFIFFSNSLLLQMQVRYHLRQHLLWNPNRQRIQVAKYLFQADCLSIHCLLLLHPIEHHFLHFQV